MKYFTLRELTVTNQQLPNLPNDEQTKNLFMLVENLLDPLREKFGAPVMVNSGFRSAAVNAAVGGAKSSQHCTGQAADIRCKDNAKLFKLIRENFLFDQLIWEKGNDRQPQWIHVSWKSNGRRNEVLRFDGKRYWRI
jgi:hypothetical protein